MASLTPANKGILDQEFIRLDQEREELEAEIRRLGTLQHEEVDIDGTVDEIMASVRGFADLFPHGTLEEQKEFIRLWVEKIELNPDKMAGKVHMKRFPLPASGNGNSSFEMVAGPRIARQKTHSAPIDVIDIQFENQSGALVPVGPSPRVVAAIRLSLGD